MRAKDHGSESHAETAAQPWGTTGGGGLPAWRPRRGTGLLHVSSRAHAGGCLCELGRGVPQERPRAAGRARAESRQRWSFINAGRLTEAAGQSASPQLHAPTRAPGPSLPKAAKRLQSRGRHEERMLRPAAAPAAAVAAAAHAPRWGRRCHHRGRQPSAPVRRRRPRGWGRGRRRGGQGHGEGRPRRSTCPGRPVAHLEKCPALGAADGQGVWVRPGRKSHQSTTLPPLSPLFFSRLLLLYPHNLSPPVQCVSVQVKDIFQSLLKHFFETFQPVILKFEGPFLKCKGAG